MNFAGPTRDRAASGVPDRGCHHGTWTGNASHLGYGQFGLGHEVQDQERENTVEAAVCKIQRAGVSDFECDSLVANVVSGMTNVDG